MIRRLTIVVMLLVCAPWRSAHAQGDWEHLRRAKLLRIPAQIGRADVLHRLERPQAEHAGRVSPIDAVQP